MLCPGFAGFSRSSPSRTAEGQRSGKRRCTAKATGRSGGRYGGGVASPYSPRLPSKPRVETPRSSRLFAIHRSQESSELQKAEKLRGGVAGAESKAAKEEARQKRARAREEVSGRRRAGWKLSFSAARASLLREGRGGGEGAVRPGKRVLLSQTSPPQLAALKKPLMDGRTRGPSS